MSKYVNVYHVFNIYNIHRSYKNKNIISLTIDLITPYNTQSDIFK